MDKKLTMSDTYQDGRRLGKKAEKYPNGQPKMEGTYLFAREVLKSNYDWWNGTVKTTTTREGKDQRHGKYVTWHKNGQKEEDGQYLNDLPIGKSNWWFENGQKAIEGQYVNGERNGQWIWWHENGQKSVTGEFVKGVEIGKWTWWNEDGKVANSARITQGQSTFSEDEPNVPDQASVPKAPPVPRTAGKSPAGKSTAAKTPSRQARAPKRTPAPTNTIRR